MSALSPKIPNTYISIRTSDDEKIRKHTLRQGYNRFKQSDAKSMTLTSAGFSVIIVKSEGGYKIFFKDWKESDKDTGGSGVGREEIEKGIDQLLKETEYDQDQD